MKKSILLFLLILFPIIANAYDFCVDGIYYYKTSNTSVNVTYRNMDYNCYSGNLIIPSTVTYSGQTYSVTGVEMLAFALCNSLYSVTFPNSVTTIGERAFFECTGLRSVTLPNSITKINSSTFQSCTNLTSIDIPNSVKTIGDYAFNGCTKLSDVTIPSSVTSIGNSAFIGARIVHLVWNAKRCNSTGMMVNNIEDVSIGEEVETLPEGFLKESRIQSLVIPNSVVSIAKYAFYGCANLKSLTVGKSVSTIGSYVFSACNGLTDLTWNAISCSSLGDMTTSNIMRVNIGQDVVLLPSYFVRNSRISEVTIPNSVMTISSYAFAGCSSLTNVTIPQSVTSIGGNAFNDCNTLSCVIMMSTTPPSGSYSMFPSGQLIYVPKVSNYKNSNYWKQYNLQGFYTITPQITRAIVASNNSNYFTLIKAITRNNNGQVLNTINAYNNELVINDLTPNSNYYTTVIVSVNQEQLDLDDQFMTENISLSQCNSTSISMTRLVLTFTVNRDDGLMLNKCGVESNSENYFGQIIETTEDSYTIECQLTELSPDYLDYYRPWVQYKDEKYYGNSVSFRTLPVTFSNYHLSASTQTTLTPVFTTSKDAGFIIESCGIENESDILEGQIINSTVDNYNIECIVTGLSPNCNYSYRPWVQFKGVKYYGYYNTFSTASIEINNNVTVTPTSVFLTGNYTSPGDAVVTDAYITYNGERYETLYKTGLNPSTSYYYTYTIETTSGNQVSSNFFYTPSLSMVAQPARMLTNTTVMFEAQTNMIDEETMVGFEWRRYDAPDEMPSTKVYSPVFGGKIAGTLKNLTENIYYKYRPFYTSNSGKSYYGNWVAFLTADAGVVYEPMVYTYNSPEVTQTEATLQGVALRGSDDITEQGFEYWKSGSGNVTRVQATGERMSKKVNSLQSGAKYTFRAFLKAGGVTRYGNEVEFVTLSNSLDVNDDGEINIADINTIIDFILTGKPGLKGDVNGDGEVNIADINTVIDAILKN